MRRGGSSTLFSCLPGAVFKSFSVCLCSRSPSLAPTAILYVSLCFPLSHSLSLILSYARGHFALCNGRQGRPRYLQIMLLRLTRINFSQSACAAVAFTSPPPFLSLLPPTNHKQIRCRANLLSSKLCTSPKLAANE